MRGESRPNTPPDDKKLSSKQRDLQNYNPKGLKILTEIECEYMQALLKKKSQTDLHKTLEDTFKAAKLTIEVLSENLIRMDVSNYVLFSNYPTADRKSTVKLVIRAKLLYEARRDCQKIFKNIIELEALMRPKAALWLIL